jgi:hypothetical protein
LRKRKAAYAALEKLVLEEHRPVVPLYSMLQTTAWAAGWKGIAVDSMGNWRLEKAKPE